MQVGLYYSRPMTERRARIALCLPGGGPPGAMFQIGAIAALEDHLNGFKADDFDLYVGTSSGATVGAALAAGRKAQRIYRSFLDPADDYFPLERRHILRMDLAEWRRTVQTALSALGHGSRSLLSQRLAPSPSALWEELARLYDSMPAGMFSLDAYERFLEENFAKRLVPNAFRALPRALRIIAHDLDSGAPVAFGAPGFDHVPVSRACIASMATPPLFSPVRIGDSHYINPAPAQMSHVDVASEFGATVVVVINPMVPLRVTGVPTGHGVRPSVRDKGAMWVSNQANRIKLHNLLWTSIRRVRSATSVTVLVIEPDPTDGQLFMHNLASFGARRAILEYAYLYTSGLVKRWGDTGQLPIAEAGWSMAVPKPESEEWG